MVLGDISMVPVPIVMTGYKRADYTAQVLASLSACRCVEDTILYAFIETGYPAVKKAFESYQGNKVLRFNNHRLGCNANTFQALDFGTALHPFVIHIEDDTVLDMDALIFLMFGMKHYAIASCYRAPGRSEKDDLSGTFLQRWFYPWGYAIRSDLWSFARPHLEATSSVSWDSQLNLFLKKTHRLLQICPKAARSLNIGWENGEHIPDKQWHINNIYNIDWAGSIKHEPTIKWDLPDQDMPIEQESAIPQVVQHSWKRRRPCLTRPG
jgi:hypothetical protein